MKKKIFVRFVRRKPIEIPKWVDYAAVGLSCSLSALTAFSSISANASDIVKESIEHNYFYSLLGGAMLVYNVYNEKYEPNSLIPAPESSTAPAIIIPVAIVVSRLRDQLFDRADSATYALCFWQLGATLCMSFILDALDRAHYGYDRDKANPTMLKKDYPFFQNIAVSLLYRSAQTAPVIGCYSITHIAQMCVSSALGASVASLKSALIVDVIVGSALFIGVLNFSDTIKALYCPTSEQSYTPDR